MKHLIIIGAGGFGREIYCSATESLGFGSEFDIKGFLDPNIHVLDGFEGYPPILGVEDTYKIVEDDVFVCAFGNIQLKKKCCEKILSKGGVFYTIIHNTAYISKNVKIGDGCIVLAGARIHCDSKVGNYVIIQPYATIGHDTIIGDWSLINTGVVCGGASKIGEGVVIHINSAVMPSAIIGDCAIVGAGSVTLRRVKAGQTVFGVPAKPVLSPKANT